ncbi:cation transporter [Candidatus Izemoplasma sp. B36]|uniref:cation transporter n=1 Tax=Candidatus Izemoplasma sp. B36 TaxID=3242468 RepID=UPI003556376A
MKKAIVENICCEGCAEHVKHIFENIYGIKDVKVSVDDSSVTYHGYISKRIIETALEGTNYKLIRIEKI